jgi:DNA-directed RNA polymerase specialized sigma24 family protein
MDAAVLETLTLIASNATHRYAGHVRAEDVLGAAWEGWASSSRPECREAAAYLRAVEHANILYYGRRRKPGRKAQTKPVPFSVLLGKTQERVEAEGGEFDGGTFTPVMLLANHRVDPDLAAVDERDSFEHLISRLMPRHRRLIRALYVDRLTYAEASAALGVPVNSLWQWMMEVKREMKGGEHDNRLRVTG